MRVAAAVLLVALSAACTEPDVPKYELNPGGPTIQIPTTIRLSALQGIGADAQHAYVTASLRDQQGRGIADTLLAFSTSKGTIEPAIARTNVSGEAKSTVTNGTDLTVSVSGAGLTASMDVALAASLSVSVSASRAEKNVPVTLTANINSDATPPLRFVWNFGDGQSAATAVATVTHTWADDGPVTINVSVTDAIDRRGTTSLSIVVRDNPEPPAPPAPTPPPAPAIDVTLSVSPTQPIAGQPAMLTATATPTNGATSVTSFDWDCLNDGTIDASTPGNTFACTFAAAGTPTARVVAHAGAVMGSATKALTVLADAPILLNVVVSSLPPYAVNASISFTGTVTSTGSVPIGLTWYWDWDNTPPDDEVFVGLNSPQTRAHSFNSAGTKTIKVRAVHGPSSREAIGLATVTIPSPP